MYTVSLANEAPGRIDVFYAYDGTVIASIDGNGGTSKENWNPDCFAIREEGRSFFFHGRDLPKEAFAVHPFSKSLSASYDAGVLTYFGADGRRVLQVRGESACR